MDPDPPPGALPDYNPGDNVNIDAKKVSALSHHLASCHTTSRIAMVQGRTQNPPTKNSHWPSGYAKTREILHSAGLPITPALAIVTANDKRAWYRGLAHVKLKGDA
jgi:hypothetical protein